MFGEHRELYSGLIRLHVLHHASKEPIFGLQMIEELGRHGYKVSPGTFYPLLQGMENKGLLRSSQQGNRHDRRVYRATPEGGKALAVAKQRLQELFRELFEDVLAARRSRGPRSAMSHPPLACARLGIRCFNLSCDRGHSVRMLLLLKSAQSGADCTSRSLGSLLLPSITGNGQQRS